MRKHVCAFFLTVALCFTAHVQPSVAALAVIDAAAVANLVESLKNQSMDFAVQMVMKALQDMMVQNLYSIITQGELNLKGLENFSPLDVASLYVDSISNQLFSASSGLIDLDRNAIFENYNSVYGPSFDISSGIGKSTTSYASSMTTALGESSKNVFTTASRLADKTALQNDMDTTLKMLQAAQQAKGTTQVGQANAQLQAMQIKMLTDLKVLLAQQSVNLASTTAQQAAKEQFMKKKMDCFVSGNTAAECVDSGFAPITPNVNLLSGE